MSPTPNFDSFQPPKENGSRGTGTPTLTPTIPALARSIDVARHAAALGEDRRGVAVGRRVLDRDRLVHVAARARSRAPGRRPLPARSASRAVTWSMIVGPTQKPLFAPGHRGLPPVDQHLRARPPRPRRWRARSVPSPRAEMTGPTSDPGPSRALAPRPRVDDVIGRGDRDHHRRGHAALARRSRDIDATTLPGGHLGIGVGHHDQVILRAAERQDPLEARRAPAVDRLGDRRRADEADRVDAGMIADRLDRLASAVHHVEHAVGESRLAQQRRDAAGADSGTSSDGFRMKRVAERDGVRNGPVRHHAREVERRDRRDDAERIAARSGTRPRGSPRGPRPTAICGSEQANSVSSIALSTSASASLLILPCSSVISAASSVDVPLEQRLVAVEDLHPLLDRRGGPAGEGPAGGGDGLVHLDGAAERHAADDRTGRRVEHVEESRAAGDGLAADPVMNVRMRARSPALLRGCGGSEIKGGHGYTPVG